MRYPVTAGGSKQEFDDKWYIAQGFGNPTSYGFHEGVDINLKTGGDTDLGQELKAIANGKVTYYHYSSHPSVNYGRHLVLKIDGAWGTRWVHYAHCDTADFKFGGDVSEGQIVGRVGKSGTPYAHLHFSIFKVDPASVGGIDVIANTQQKLNDWWEDPIRFIDTWSQAQVPPTQPIITDSTVIPQIYGWEVQRIRSELIARDQKISELLAKMNEVHRISAV